MKKVLLIAVIGMLSLGRAIAQPRLQEPELYIGVHGGVLFQVTYFTPQIEGAFNWTDRLMLSGNGGLVLHYNGHKYCGFQVEVNYMQRGWREKTSVGLVDVDYMRKLHYIEMPFLSQIYFGKKVVRGFINLGPQIGYCIKDDASGTQHPTQQAQYAPLDHKFDWGLAGGLGMLFRTNKAGTFQLEARFSYSLGGYFNNTKADYFSHSNPMGLSVNVGYLWEIKKKSK